MTNISFFANANQNWLTDIWLTDWLTDWLIGWNWHIAEYSIKPREISNWYHFLTSNSEDVTKMFFDLRGYLGILIGSLSLWRCTPSKLGDCSAFVEQALFSDILFRVQICLIQEIWRVPGDPNATVILPYFSLSHWKNSKNLFVEVNKKITKQTFLNSKHNFRF